MSKATAIWILLGAAALEAAGDAVVRAGLHTGGTAQRTAMFVAGALLLFTYGCTVNAPPWDFGRLIGLYVVFFFVIAQAISWVFFKQAPSPMVLGGGLLIVAGGVVIAYAKV